MRDQIAGVNKQMTEMKPDTVPVMRELPADKQRVTKIQRRGNFLDVGDAVTAGTPAAFPPLPAGRAGQSPGAGPLAGRRRTIR